MRILGSALVLAAAIMAVPAVGQTINFTSATNSSTNGSVDGNVRTFSDASTGISVRASAWSYDPSTGTVANAWLGQFNHGLGVTNQGETGGSNSHTTDNSGYQDFILLVFNQAVTISSATLVPFAVNGSTDNDAWVSYGTQSNLYSTLGNPASSINSTLWSSMLSHDWNVVGAASPYNVNLASGGNTGNVWLIGAAFSGAPYSVGNPDRANDGFKLASINVTSAVPEPSTWAMMLFGFAAIGAVSRRSRRRALALT